ADAGVDALLVVTPYYSKPSQSGVSAHFAAIANGTDLPICVYDIMGRAGIHVETDTLLRISELPNVKVVKDAKGDLAADTRLLANTDLAWYSGDDPLHLPWLSVGASGFISVVGHAPPRELAELWDAFDRGDIDRAREINAQTLIPLAEQQARLGGVTLAKEALRMQGIEVGDPRLPVLGADAEELEDLRKTMKKAGVLKE